jgi:translation elongation factor EF-1beta
MFYYSPYRTPEEFWKNEGKHWSKVQDKFIGPNGAVAAAVQQLVSPSDTQEQKLRKIYAAIQELENSDYTREHSRVEDKAEGLSQLKTTDDIWTRKRGSSDQIAELFVAMARAAGMKAYVMAVTNRDRSLFLPTYLTMYQLDDYLAIVNVDGKERFFDPGSRYCPFGHLAWKHTASGGLRQTDGGTTLVASPGESYQESVVTRVANLKMDETGSVSGTVDLAFKGAPALKWRQMSLTDDKETVEKQLKEYVEQMLPGGMEVKVLSVDKLSEYELPMAVKLDVKGPIGSPTGKRLVVPGDIFETNAKATFAHEKRELAVWLPYCYSERDAIRINFPSTFQVESVPPDGAATMPKMAVYNLKVAPDATGVTIRRNLYLGEILYKTEEYPDLRKFYSQFEAKDQEPLVLKVASPSPSGN